MKIADFIKDPNATITEAFNHPVMKIKPRAAKPNPDYEDAAKATVNAIEYEVMEAVADIVRPRLQEILDNQILMDGEHSDSDDQGSWEAAVDDRVELAVEEFVPILSADWLGTHTIGADLHLKDGVNKFASSMGREVYRQLIDKIDKSPAKIMSAAGIGSAMLTERLNAHIAQKEASPMTTDEDNLNAVIGKIHAYLGKDFDIMSVFDDLDSASDDDVLLAQGAGARLGLGDDDIEELQNFRLIEGEDAPQKLMDMLQAGPAKAPGKKPAAKKAPAEKKPAAKKEPKKKEPVEDAAAEAEGGLSGEHIQSLKEACTFKDADMALGCGVSRATFNNWANGKTEPDLNADQYAFLRGEVVDRINKLLVVLSALDGTEHEEIF